MQTPYSWIPKREPGDSEFKERISEAFRQSYRVTMPNVMGLFERLPPKKRRRTALKAVGSRMGRLFAAKLFI